MRTCPESRYHDELNRKAEQEKLARIKSYYDANPRVLVWEKRAMNDLKKARSLFRLLEYALTGKRNPHLDKIMCVAGKPTSEIIRDYERACHDLNGARMRIEEIK